MTFRIQIFYPTRVKFYLKKVAALYCLITQALLYNVLTTAGKDVVDFSSRGWRPTKANVEKVASSIAALKHSECNTIFLDLCSNSAYMGTDSNGLPAATEKMLDGKYHLRGDLQTAPGRFSAEFSKIAHQSLRLLPPPPSFS